MIPLCPPSLLSSASKHICTASTALGLVNTRPPCFSGWKSWEKEDILNCRQKIQKFNEPILIEFTLSDNVFNETNLKDSTGIRVALCPCVANSWGIKRRTSSQCLLGAKTYVNTAPNKEGIHLDVRVRSRLSIPGLFQKQHMHIGKAFKKLERWNQLGRIQQIKPRWNFNYAAIEENSQSQMLRTAKSLRTVGVKTQRATP